MTNSTPSEPRLDRLEALAETTLLAIQQQSQQISELHNTLAEESQQISELRNTVTQQSGQVTELREGIADVVLMISEQAERQDARHAESEQRFENLLQDARADRQRADTRHAESMQRIDQALEDAKADRQRIDEALARGDRDRAINENEHRAFRETFQTLLAEVARIWQRLAG